MPALLTTALPGLPPPKCGKVREVYDLGDSLLIVATDRISAFDVVMANGIPDKGRILNQMSAFWFEMFSGICPNHVLTTDDTEISRRVSNVGTDFAGRCTLAKKARPLSIECVARGYIAGSLYREYLQEGPNVHGLKLPEGLRNSDKLPEPIFTPATKAEQGHDENLSFDQAVRLVGPETAEQARRWTLEIYSAAARYAESKGIILADTKFEFGLVEGQLTWIDEALTPDSSRFWEASEYQPGNQQPSYDKQFVRDYLEEIRFDKRPPGPTLPDDVVCKTREKYLLAFGRLTGRTLVGSSG